MAAAAPIAIPKQTGQHFWGNQVNTAIAKESISELKASGRPPALTKIKKASANIEETKRKKPAVEAISFRANFAVDKNAV
jgi:hypothetical protein